MQKNRYVTIILILVIALFSIHLFGSLSDGMRADVTEDQLYSLTEGTQSILERIRTEPVESVRIKLYFSETVGKTLPEFIKDFLVFEDYLQSLLKEYERRSDGKISVSILDPQPDGDLEEEAVKDGLKGRNANKDGDQFFFGLVLTTATGSREIIPFETMIEMINQGREGAIEYEISKRLYRLLWPSKKRIGVISSLDVLAPPPIPGRPQGPQSWGMFQLLRQSYGDVSLIPADADELAHDDYVEVTRDGESKRLLRSEWDADHPKDEKIDKSIKGYDLVIVVQPKNLSDANLWALDEWIVTGGNAIVYVDPYCYVDQNPAQGQNPYSQPLYDHSSQLTKLLDAWGIECPPRQIAADLTLATDRQFSRSDRPSPWIVDLSFDAEHAKQTFATDHPTLLGVNAIEMALAGHLERRADAKVEFLPLIHLTENGDVLKFAEAQSQFDQPEPNSLKMLDRDIMDPSKLRRLYSPTKAYTVAGLSHGQFPSAYPNGTTLKPASPPLPPGAPPGTPQPEPTGDPIEKKAVDNTRMHSAKVLIVADVDILSDLFSFNRSPFGMMASNDNHKFFLNSIDFMFDAKELLSARAKERISRPFELFDSIEEKMDKDLLEKEKEIESEVSVAQTQLNEKMQATNNVALRGKKLQDEIDKLNATLKEKSLERKEVRRTKRAAIQDEEEHIRFMMFLPPALVALLGLGVFLVRWSTRSSAMRKGAHR